MVEPHGVLLKSTRQGGQVSLAGLVLNSRPYSIGDYLVLAMFVGLFVGD